MWKRWIGFSSGILLLALSAGMFKGRSGVDPMAAITVRDLMNGFLDPAADEIWNSVGTVIDEAGVHEVFPRSEEDWERLEEAAQRVVKYAEVLTRPGLKAAKEGEKSYAPGIELEPHEVDVLIAKNREDFETMARDLKQVAETVRAAAGARDVKPLLGLGERMQQSCENCHSTFWYPKQARLNLNFWMYVSQQ